MSRDRQLVEAVLREAPGAFARLVDTHNRLCWHILMRLTQNPEDARDLCQETFLRVHQRLPQFRFESSLKTWIGRIAYSIGLRHLERSAKRRETHADDGDARIEYIAGEDDIEADIERTQVRALIRVGMDALPPVQRLLVTLYHVDELSIAEIAEVTGLPSGTIKVYLARARARLRDHLQAGKE